MSADRVKSRPSREAAIEQIRAYVVHLGYPQDIMADLRIVEDGEDAWAFWFTPSDATSYAKHSSEFERRMGKDDLVIEWLGTSWEADDG